MSEPKAGGHYRLMYPTEYIAAPELQGRDVALTIKGVSIDEMPLAGKSEKQKRPIVRFVETDKKLVLNKTNAKIVAKLFGPQTAEWVGKRVALYPTTTKFGPETVDCIRVRDKVPPAKSSKATPDDDVPDFTEAAR